jgi:hypothetical protein
MGTNKILTTSSGAVLDCLKIDGLGILNNSEASITQIELAGAVKHTSIARSKIKLNNANLFKTTATHENISLSSSSIYGSDLAADRLVDFRGTITGALKILGCDISKLTYLVYSTANLNVLLSNLSIYDSSTSNTLLYASSNSMLVKGINVISDSAIGVYTGTGTLRIDCKDINLKNTTKVTGQKGDELSVLGVRKIHNGTSFVDI